MRVSKNYTIFFTILQDHSFYNCPSFAVIAGDFSKGLSAAIAQKAA
jgi:hypothetical protein